MIHENMYIHNFATRIYSPTFVAGRPPIDGLLTAPTRGNLSSPMTTTTSEETAFEAASSSSSFYPVGMVDMYQRRKKENSLLIRSTISTISS